MKTFAKIIATCAVLSVALTPMVTKAVSYYQGYTCHYRDISGSCLNYQTSDPYFFNNRTLSPYGNRRTLNSFNAYELEPSPWDNRFSNDQYGVFRYEEEDDDGEGWRYYQDEDDIFRPYYLERGDNRYQNYYYNNNNHRYYEFEYEHTRVYIK